MEYDSYSSFGGPKTIQQLMGWYRISSAQSIASGAFPAHMRTYYNGLQDPLDSGMFQLISNSVKFIRENSGLWHALEFITPKIEVSNKKVFTSAFGQSIYNRSVLHVVNGNYDEIKMFNRVINDVAIKMETGEKPSRVWVTTPDKFFDERRTILDYTYENGYVSFTLPELEVYAVVVLEYKGEQYDPVYEPLRVVMPFPGRVELPVSNTTEFRAVKTEGITGDVAWYVNNVRGGNDQLGTIDENGRYTAPRSVTKNFSVAIKAESKERPSAYAQQALRIVSRLELPWQPDLQSPKGMDEMIPGFEMVDGRGDWRVEYIKNQLELVCAGAAEGFGNGDITETAQYPPFIVTGDQYWSDYKFSFNARRNGPALNCYNDLSGTGLGIVFRYCDSQNYYMYFIDENGGVRFVKVINGGFTVVNCGNVGSIPLDDIYTEYKVEVKGNKFYLYNYGSLISINSDNNLQRGAVGFKTSYISCNFSDISVKPLN